MPDTENQNYKSTADDKHWLEYAIFVFVVIGAVAACAAAYYTRQQWLTADDQEKRSLRAYMLVSSKEIENFGEGKIGHVQGIFENVGQTPVYDAIWVSGINIFPRNGTFTYPDCKIIIQQSNSKKWSFGKMSYPDKDRTTVFTQDEVARVQNGQAVVYFNGRVCYRDIFREIRRTDFCIFWAWKGNGLDIAIYCDQGNEAD